jgi:hypothetical protein
MNHANATLQSTASEERQQQQEQQLVNIAC